MGGAHGEKGRETDVILGHRCQASITKTNSDTCVWTLSAINLKFNSYKSRSKFGEFKSKSKSNGYQFTQNHGLSKLG